MHSREPEASDEVLMQKYQQGDEAAFRELYRAFSPRVYGYLRSRVSDKQKVDEIFQMVFLKLHQSRAQYDPKFPFSPWLFTICRTVLIDAFRRGSLFPSSELVPLESVVHSLAANTPVSPARSKEMDLPLEKLPAAKREILEYRYVEGMSFEAISAQLNISPQGARQRVSRAVRALRQILGKKGGN